MYGKPDIRGHGLWFGLQKGLHFSSPVNRKWKYKYPNESQPFNEIYLDIWENTSNLKYYKYMSCSEKVRKKIEYWGEANDKHATVYVKSVVKDSNFIKILSLNELSDNQIKPLTSLFLPDWELSNKKKENAYVELYTA